MSKTEQFKNKFIGKINDNGFGRYPGECVSLVQRWLNFNGFPHEGHGNGEGFRYALVNRGWGKHVPLKDIQPGDIIAGARGKYGHVAIALGNGEIFDAAGPSAGGSGVARISKLFDFVNRYSDVKVTRLNGFVNQTKKSNEEIAKEVIDGKWGNNPKRKNDLIKAGYDYNTIQAIVNKKSAPSKPTLKSNETVAREVIDGKWGNGASRKKRLSQAGYDHKVIQAIVNKLLK